MTTKSDNTLNEIENFKEKVDQKKKLFIIRALKLEELLNEKSPTFKDGLAKGYTQGVIDTLKLLGLIPTT